jgi:hypothetical protein
MINQIIKEAYEQIIKDMQEGSCCPKCGFHYREEDLDQGRHVSITWCQTMIWAASQTDLYKDASLFREKYPDYDSMPTGPCF